MQQKDFDIVLYGATGLTGRMILDRLPVTIRPRSVLLAGRDPERLAALAARYGLAWQACQLDDSLRLRQLAARGKVLLNVAAPFIRSAAALAPACRAGTTHYVDCSGEFSAVERVAKETGRALSATPAVGLVGAGADILLALIEKNLSDSDKGMPDSEVHVCYSAGPSLARGSVASLLANGQMESWVWGRNGLQQVPPGKYERAFDLPLTSKKTNGARRTIRIVGSAVALPDLTLLVKDRYTKALTSHFEMTPWQRHLLFMQGLNHAPQSTRFLRTIANMAPGLMPERLDTGLHEDREGVQTVVVEWVDGFGRGWRTALGTKDAHTFTAQAMVHVAGMMLKEARPPTGYRSPSSWFRKRRGGVDKAMIIKALGAELTFIEPPARFGWVESRQSATTPTS